MFRKIFFFIMLFGCGLSFQARAEAQPDANQAAATEYMQLLDVIDQEVKKMSPQEQQEFYKLAQSMSDKMATMSEEQIFDLFTNMSDEKLMEAFGEFLPPADTGVNEEEKSDADVSEEGPLSTEKSEKSAEAVPVIAITSEHKKLDDTLRAIIDDSALLNQKIPFDLDSTIEEWQKSKKLPNWSAKKTWAEVQEFFDTLIAKLSSIRNEHDNKKRAQLFDAILKDKQLVNNLEQFKSILENHTAITQSSTPFRRIKNASKKEKETLARLCDGIAEALFVLDIPASIDSVIASFSASDEKTKKEQEQAVKKAESQKSVAQSPMIQAGRSGGDLSSSYNQNDSYEPWDSGASYSPYSSGSPRSGGRVPSLEGEGYPTTPEAGDRKNASAGSVPSSRGQKGQKGSKQKEEAKNQVQKKEAGKKKSAGSQQETKTISDFEKQLKTANDTVAGIKKVLGASLAHHIRDESKPLDANGNGKDKQVADLIHEAGTHIMPLVWFSLLEKQSESSESSVKGNVMPKTSVDLKELANFKEEMASLISEKDRLAGNNAREKFAFYVENAAQAVIDKIQELLPTIEQHGGKPGAEDLISLERVVAANKDRETLSESEKKELASLLTPEFWQKVGENPELLISSYTKLIRYKAPDLLADLDNEAVAAYLP